MAVYTTIDNPELYFQTKLYTGTGTSTAFTLDGSENMQPDAVWIKQRAGTTNHKIFDSVRGVQEALQPNDVDAEATESNGLTAFGSDGFTLGDHGDLNASSASQVAWCWKESATAGFDIVSYAGTGSAKTESHSLSAVPKLIIVKNRSANDAWQVYHGANTAAPETDYLVLNTTAATADAADRWSDEAPTSSVFTLGDGVEVNTNTENYIAYCFADVQGFSKFGSYEGNGNADGAFIYTGFRPAFVMTKSVDSTSAWEMFDNKREGYNVDNDALVANATTVEATADQIDLLSNGFKLRIATDPNVAETYIYAAFAEAPFVNSNGVPCNAR